MMTSAMQCVVQHCKSMDALYLTWPVVSLTIGFKRSIIRCLACLALFTFFTVNKSVIVDIISRCHGAIKSRTRPPDSLSIALRSFTTGFFGQQASTYALCTLTNHLGPVALTWLLPKCYSKIWGCDPYLEIHKSQAIFNYNAYYLFSTTQHKILGLLLFLNSCSYEGNNLTHRFLNLISPLAGTQRRNQLRRDAGSRYSWRILSWSREHVAGARRQSKRDVLVKRSKVGLC